MNKCGVCHSPTASNRVKACPKSPRPHHPNLYHHLQLANVQDAGRYMCEVDGGLGGKTREVTHSVQILGTFVLSIWIRMAISSGDCIGCGENDKDFLNSCPCDNEMGLVERGNCGGRCCDQVELKSLLFVPLNCWNDEPLFWVTYIY